MPQQEKTLSPKEWLFCQYYSRTRDARQAAAKAGYSWRPERTGVRLLHRPEIQRELAALQKKQGDHLGEVRAGLKRLAFEGIYDAVRLLYADEVPDTLTLEGMNLFGISEIKRPKTGGMEIKFFDRVKAFEKLSELCEGDPGQDAAKSFYEALESSAAR